MTSPPTGAREEVLARAEAIRKATNRAHRTARIGIGVAAALMVSLVAISLESVWPGSVWQRWVFACLVYGSAVGALVMAIRTPRGQRQTRASAVGLAERRISGREEQARAAVELAEAPTPESTVGQALTDRAMAQGLARLRLFDLQEAIDRQPAKRALAAMVCGLMMVAAVWIAAPRAFTMSAARVLDPLGDHPPYSSIRIVVDVTNDDLRIGDDLVIDAVIRSGNADPVTLEYQIGEGEIARMTMRTVAASDGETTSRAVMRDLRDSIRFRVRAGGARTRWMTLTPALAPRVRDMRLMVTPPLYTGERSHIVMDWEGTGVEARIGATVDLLVELSTDIATIEATGAEISDIHERTASVSWRVMDAGTVTRMLNVETAAGSTLDQPIEVMIHGMADEAPTIRVVSPRMQADEIGAAGPDSVIPLLAMAIDDIGLESFAAQWRVEDNDAVSEGWQALDADVWPVGRSLRIRSAVTPRELGAPTGARVDVRFVALDQRPNAFGGAQETIAGPFSFRVVSEADAASMARGGVGATAMNAQGESVEGQAGNEAIDVAGEDDASRAGSSDATAPTATDAEGTLRGEGESGGAGGRSSTQGQGSEETQSGEAHPDGADGATPDADQPNHSSTLEAFRAKEGDAFGIGFGAASDAGLAPIDVMRLNRLPERYRAAVIRYYELMARSNVQE